MSGKEIQSKIAANPTIGDPDLNAPRARLQIIPSVGPALDKLMFGLMDDLRSKRFQATIKEIGEKVEALGLENQVDENEDFGNLVRDVAPPLSRSANEDRRRRFRELILNPTQIPKGDARWEELYFASKLLDSIGAPGPAILSNLARCTNERVWMFSRPYPYIHDGTVDLNQHNLGEACRSALFLAL
jgi:hypothetical protein